MAEPAWKQILDRLSETEKKIAKELLRKNLDRQGQPVSEEVLEQMAERAVEDARAVIRKKSKQTIRGFKSGIKAFWAEFRAGDDD